MSAVPDDELLAPGHRACPGCGSILAIRYALKALGKNTIVCAPTGCMEVVTTPYPETAWRVPWIHVAFENAAAVASGVEVGLKSLGKRDIKVVAIGGDGGTVDIGLQALSGMVERNDNVLYICTDNEAYMNCLSTSSLIMTKDGLKKITEVKEGDEIYAFDQKTHQPVLKRCTGVFDNGEREVFELETLHHTIRATPNHPFLVLKRNSREENKLVWKTLCELNIGDEVVVLKNEHFEMEKIRELKLVGKEPTLDLRVEDEHNFIADGIVVHNTGIQRSGATPFAAWTTTTPVGKVKRGEDRPKKDMPAIIAAHRAPYVATASVGYPLDYIKKVKKAASIEGPTYIHVHCPCGPGWRIDSSKTIEVAKLAVLTGMWNLYEIENGVLKLTFKPPKRKPVAEYLKMQRRFRHLTDEEIAGIQRTVDEQCKHFGIE